MYRHVFHAGEWTDVAGATVSVSSIALRYAVSVFEGVRLYWQPASGAVRPFLLLNHLERLGTSLRLVRIPDPGVTRIPALIDELIERNEIRDDTYVRIAASAGNNGLMGADVEPLLTITGTPMGRKRWLAEGRGMRLQVSGWQRAAEEAFPSAAKNISGYAGARLALLEAKDAGYDGCVLTAHDGRLCEAPTAALFVVRDGVLHTPALSDGVLPSITREWTLRTAARLGLPLKETPLYRSDAYLAEEAFLCGTGVEFGPVSEFDGHSCRLWPRNPVTRILVQEYFDEARGLDD